jgi:hypothetical protein
MTVSRATQVKFKLATLPLGFVVVKLGAKFIENRLQIQVHGAAGSLGLREVVVGGIGICVDEKSDTIV